MIHARSQLYRQLREFFETYLRGVFVWRDVEHLPAERVEAVEGRSKFPFGKEHEVVSIRFGMYDLSVRSPHEAPPLGSIEIHGPDGTLRESSLDPTAWARVGKFVTVQQERMKYYV